jgi:hypothetical protein
MLSVSYFEKGLYELSEEEVTAERVQQLADKVELEIQGGYSLRPIMAVSSLETLVAVAWLSCRLSEF